VFEAWESDEVPHQDRAHPGARVRLARGRRGRPIAFVDSSPAGASDAKAKDTRMVLCPGRKRTAASATPWILMPDGQSGFKIDPFSV